MRVCVVGSGGREHALAVVLGRTAEVVVTPGNPGIPGSVSTPPEEIDADLFVIGPEQPLVDGLADRLRERGALVYGPGADGAQLEGSKAWMKQILVEAGVATAAHGSFSEVEPALAFLDTMHDLFVVKTDGLAAGKGVVVTELRAEAEDAVRSYLSGEAFGDAGRTLVIEEGLTGPELSVFAICDGTRAVPMSPATDFKRVADGDLGPNTGGMGAYSPVDIATPAIVDQLMADAVEPTLAALTKRGIDYRGTLYAGLMFTPSGPKMLEYNVRFGDPETQVVLPRLESDLAALLADAAAGSLGPGPTFSTDATTTVVCASENYPKSPRTGDVIEGIDAARALDGVDVFCAGVGAGPSGELITAGGRVLNVVGRGPNLAEARRRAYAGVAEISWSGMHYRTDIALEASQRSG
ncbi:MAG: phosphoribosylamine--glycine ligase [Acidimicrobiales bacterium]|nr:phosphoribosylamine--glycine ligase [Acidimicrobiales bacterium]